MANQCNNSFSFTGKDLTEIKKLITEAIQTNKEKREGWLPEFIDVKKLHYAHYLFDVDIIMHSEDELVVSCWTKWSPPMEEIEQICRMAKVNCTCQYEELGCLLYGQFEYLYESDYTTDISLDESDIDRVSYNEEKDIYLFDGEIIESDYDAYQQMLDEKLGN